MRIKAIVGSNYHCNHKKKVYAEINGIDWLVYQDALEHCSSEQYDNAWNNICDAIEAQNDLPYYWYVDRIREA